MRIQHNITAMNSYRNYTNNTSAVAKNLEKLSSGYKINRAGDDAAGLAISEKMRAQVTGLKTAQKNAKDGISLVKTGEGALTEVHDMLNRMFELSEQSSNGTYDNEVDRANLQKEISSLKTEIDRIADSVNFNGLNLLDGSLSAGGGSGAAGVPSISGLDLVDTAAVKGAQDVALTNAGTTGSNALADGDVLKATINWTDASGTSQSTTLELTFNVAAGASKGSLTTKDGKAFETAGTDVATANELAKAFTQAAKEDATLSGAFTVADGTGKLTMASKTAGANTKVVSVLTNFTPTTASAGLEDNKGNLVIATSGGKVAADAYQSFDFSTLEAGQEFTIGGQKFAFFNSQEDAVAAGSGVNAVVLGSADTIDGPEVQKLQKLIEQKTGYAASVNGTKLDFKAPTGANAISGKGLTLQIGDTADSFNQLTVSIKDMHASAMGIDGVDISTQTGAASAMKSIKAAINYVSDVRGDLGATQNRLEHTINNLSVMQENIQDAESSIRDVDVAEEMMAYTKNNILVQSAQAMLAQANQLPQGVLQLLQ